MYNLRQLPYTEAAEALCTLPGMWWDNIPGVKKQLDAVGALLMKCGNIIVLPCIIYGS